MIIINLVLFIGLVLLARDLQSLVGNGFNDFCVHRSLDKGGKSPPYLRGIEGDLKSFEYHL